MVVFSTSLDFSLFLFECLPLLCLFDPVLALSEASSAWTPTSKSREWTVEGLRDRQRPARSCPSTSASSPLKTGSRVAEVGEVACVAFPVGVFKTEELRVMAGMDMLSLVLEVDLRRLRRSARLNRLAVVCDPELESESEELELELSLEEVDEFNILVKIPGWDSSSIRCCGVL
jgi:hypothetical protein